MSIFICGVCGHIAFGSATDNCPVCYALKELFDQNDNVFAESAEKSKEAAVKHIPYVMVNKDCGLVPNSNCVDILVRIGETVHPMEDAHFIKWVDCYLDDTYISRVILTPGINPACCFHLKDTGAKVRIIEQCNLHGHWQKEISL